MLTESYKQKSVPFSRYNAWYGMKTFKGWIKLIVGCYNNIMIQNCNSCATICSVRFYLHLSIMPIFTSIMYVVNWVLCWIVFTLSDVRVFSLEDHVSVTIQNFKQKQKRLVNQVQLYARLVWHLSSFYKITNPLIPQKCFETYWITVFRKGHRVFAITQSSEDKKTRSYFCVFAFLSSPLRLLVFTTSPSCLHHFACLSSPLRLLVFTTSPSCLHHFACLSSPLRLPFAHALPYHIAWWSLMQWYPMQTHYPLQLELFK